MSNLFITVQTAENAKRMVINAINEEWRVANETRDIEMLKNLLKKEEDIFNKLYDYGIHSADLATAIQNCKDKIQELEFDNFQESFIKEIEEML